MTAPKLSFIVLSYNYEHYIRRTLESILDQTVGEFEVVVVDDCSTDRSREVVRSFGDPRIHLIVNERNLGGAGSYNVAVSAARGEWLVNLDADDWIAPSKAERQLTALAADPSIDVIGSWVSVVDAAGKPHPRAEEIEELVNRRHRFNLMDTWIGQNLLCRSTTMVRRAAHMRIGLYDTDMVRAPDYEIWTRALAYGLRFALLDERLTYMRAHSGGVTRGDPLGTLMEMSFAMIRNLAPLAERRAIFDAHADMVRWMASSDEIIRMSPQEAMRMLGFAVTLDRFESFSAFRAALSDPTSQPTLERIGRQAQFNVAQTLPAEPIQKLYSDIAAYIDARDFWKSQSDTWEARFNWARPGNLARRLTQRIRRQFLSQQ